MRTAMTCVKIVACFIIVMFPKGVNSCNIPVCLTWRISVDKLTLVCIVDDFYHRVFIDDPVGCTRADCFPDIDDPSCDSYKTNESITQNLTTHEIVYTVQVGINNKLSGNWSCRHGTNLHVATAEVTVQEMSNNCTVKRNDSVFYSADDFACTRSALLLTMISYFSSMMISMVVMSTTSGSRRCRLQKVNEMVTNIFKRFGQNFEFYLVCKKISFIICTVLFFFLVEFFNLLYTDSSQFKFVACGFGMIFGIINSISFLNTNDPTPVSGQV